MPLKPIDDEARTLARLGDTSDAFRDQLRLLAHYGESLRKRYEAACSYQWACTPRYEAETDRHEKRLRDFAATLGLHLYIQTDPRGAPVYVSRNPIPENSYNNAECITPREAR